MLIMKRQHLSMIIDVENALPFPFAVEGVHGIV